MTWILGVFGVLLGLFLLLWLNAIRASATRNRKLDDLLRPTIDTVAQNRPDAQDRVAELARRPETRNHLFTRLQEMGRADLFPESYRAAEKVAESDLANWLMHPNELGAAPSQMELVREIAIEQEGRKGMAFLFRFRADPSDWASGNGWMAGIAGPYWEGGGPPVGASGTFSELTPFDQMTAEQHVEHLMAARKSMGLVVPS